MDRLFVVSNRVAPVEEGKPSSGGLAVGVLDALRETGGVWFGWSGQVSQKRSRRAKITDVGELRLATVDLSRQDYEEYYNGFANGSLWPLLHNRLDMMHFERKHFAAYLRVNALFANMLASMVTSDDVVWVHDYHLIPLAEELLRAGANPSLGLFLHTPFPPYSVLKALPTSDHLIEALCAYDLIGFQTARDLSAFHEAVLEGANGRLLGDGAVEAFGRVVRAEVFPIGIDPDDMARIAATSARSAYISRFLKDTADAKIVIGVDRLDYSKGLVERFEAYGRFLESYPRYHGRITYLQIATPTRADVREYRELRLALSGIAGDISGRHAEPDWTPIRYLNRSFARRTLAGFYRVSKVGLVTPMMDGMNLVAKEYVAAQDPDDPGVLILSLFAGAAAELPEALIVNPYDRDAIVEALRTAVNMPQSERRQRWQAMMATLRRNNVTAWRRDFLASLHRAMNDTRSRARR